MSLTRVGAAHAFRRRRGAASGHPAWFRPTALAAAPCSAHASRRSPARSFSCRYGRRPVITAPSGVRRARADHGRTPAPRTGQASRPGRSSRRRAPRVPQHPGSGGTRPGRARLTLASTGGAGEGPLGRRADCCSAARTRPTTGSTRCTSRNAGMRCRGRGAGGRRGARRTDARCTGRRHPGPVRRILSGPRHLARVPSRAWRRWETPHSLSATGES